MNTESEQEKTVLKLAGLDPVLLAASAGHHAAAELSDLLGPKDDPTHEPAHWPSLGAITNFGDDETGEKKVIALADYICGRVARGHEVGPEELFRQARKVKIHDTDGAAWRTLGLEHKMPFMIFAATVQLTYATISEAIRRAAAEAERAARAKLKPVPIEDTIFEEQEPMGAMDPDRVEANRRQAEAAKTAKARARKKKPAAANDEGGSADTVMGPESAEAADNKPLSVGEKPPKVTGGGKRGGSRKPAAKKGASNDG